MYNYTYYQFNDPDAAGVEVASREIHDAYYNYSFEDIEAMSDSEKAALEEAAAAKNRYTANGASLTESEFDDWFYGTISDEDWSMDTSDYGYDNTEEGREEGFNTDSYEDEWDSGEWDSGEWDSDESNSEEWDSE